MNKYIAKSCGLRQEFRGDLLYFKGHGRRWRINLSTGTLQMGDNDFDRWANSVEASEAIPCSKKQMIAAVQRMLGRTPTTKDSDK